jgi:hypothetical protein
MHIGILKKYVVKGLIWITGILLLLYISLIIYVSLNRQKIIKQVVTELNQKLKGDVSIGYAGWAFWGTFPDISIQLKDVSVNDSLYKQHGHHFFTAKKIIAKLAVSKLLKKEPALKSLEINDGDFYLFTDSSGYSNTYLLKLKPDSNKTGNTSAKPAVLKYIRFSGIHFIIDDRQKEKLHDFSISQLNIEPRVNEKGTGIILSTKLNVLVKSMAFNLPKGVFLQNQAVTGDFDLVFNTTTKQLSLKDAGLKISSDPFLLNGRFDLSGDSPQFDLTISTKEIEYAQAKSLLPERIRKSLSIAEINKPLTVDARITGPLKGGEPKVKVNWAVTKSVLKTSFMDFEDASFAGEYTNEVVPGIARTDPNSKILITKMDAFWHGLPVRSDTIEILNLSEPVLRCDLKSVFPLASINALMEVNSLQLQSGEGNVDLRYNGPLQKNDQTNSFLNGTVTLSKGNILYIPRNVLLQDVNGRIVFRESDLFIETLQANVLNNRLVMQGRAKKLLSLMGSEPGNVNIDFSVFAPSLNLTAFSFLLSSRKQPVTGNSKQKKTHLISHIDEVLENGTLHVVLNTGKLTYKKFEATQVDANVTLLPDRYVINHAGMRHAGGKMELKGTLLTRKPDSLQATLDAKLNNVDVKKLFRSFNDFGQTGITAESIEGNFTANLGATLSFNQKGEVYPSSVMSDVSFSLKNGALVNYEPVKKLQKFIFKKRDFTNIRFAELKNKLEVRGDEIRINRMEIQSTVISLFVEGIYGKKGNTDISIQVPLSNMKKRDSSYIPENAGIDKNGGRSIFLRGRPGSDGSIQFSLDLFNKYKKKKKKKGTD